MFEEWRDVVDFEGLYQISNLGNFRRHPNKQSTNKYVKPKSLDRKVQVTRDGYLQADLCKENKKYKKTIHQMVCAAFIPNFTYGTEVNHENGNKKDCRLSNLEPSTSQANNQHAHTTGLQTVPGFSKYHYVNIVRSKYKDKEYIYWAAKIKFNRKVVFNKNFSSEVEAAKAANEYLDSIGDTVHARNVFS
jgi:hypothetical protein